MGLTCCLAVSADSRCDVSLENLGNRVLLNLSLRSYSMKKFKTLCAATFLGLLTFAMSCNNSTNPPTPPGPLQLLQPVAGATFKVGSPVTVQWKINDSTKVNGVEVDLSLDGGNSFPELLKGLGGHSFPIDTLEMTWTPNSTEVSTKCVIRVIQYNATGPYDKSGIFTVSD